MFIKILTILSLLLFLACNQVSSQEFTNYNQDPFGINIDTSGGVEIYMCDFADIDNDGDLDIIYPYYNESFLLAFQENIGSKTNPQFKAIEKLDFQIDSEAGFFLPDFKDMNSDGLVDIISFGAIDEFTGFKCTYFENMGDNSFERKAGEDIGLPGIGNGFGIVEIVDLNQDCDKDIILSGSLVDEFTQEAEVIYYYGQNSNIHDPTFVGWYDQPYSFSFMDTFQTAIIKAGDLDLDGDIDLLMYVGINDEESRIMYQENISPPNEKSDFSGPQLISPFGLADTVSGLPFLEDLDGDGDLDLLMYEDLSIYYYENTSCVNTNSNLAVSLCGESSYSLNDMSYTSSGSYTQLLSNSAGCDSTLTLNLEFNEDVNTNFQASVCEGSFYDWNGEQFAIAGDYQKSFTNASGCDSLVTLALNVIPSVQTSFEDSFCAGSEYTWNNQVYAQAGNYEQSFTSQSGCDSVVTLVLNLSSIISTSFEDSFCAGSQYDWNGETYTSTGSYEQNFVSQTGCDSIVTLLLTSSNVINTSFEAQFCAGAEYEWKSEAYAMAGSYEQSFTTQSGCDSIVTLELSELTVEYQINLVENKIEVEAENAVISWFDCDENTVIDGENQSEFTPSETGNYAAIVSQNGCESMSECFNVMITGVNEIELPEAFIYPNPASTLITLNSEQALKSDLEVQIYNLEGKVISKKMVNNKVDVSDLTPGYYYLNIQSDKRFLRLPFVIMR